MVKHINLWKYRDELTEAEKAAVRQGMKEAFEALPGQIPGIWRSLSPKCGLTPLTAWVRTTKCRKSVE